MPDRIAAVIGEEAERKKKQLCVMAQQNERHEGAIEALTEHQRILSGVEKTTIPPEMQLENILAQEDVRGEGEAEEDREQLIGAILPLPCTQGRGQGRGFF